jgi:hypothetical protein
MAGGFLGRWALREMAGIVGQAPLRVPACP